MPEYIILVDKNDNQIGYGEKLDVHEKALLHRAFSIFIYSPEKDAFLMQRRARSKYHSGGLLSNSCCSHPRKGETLHEALSRCVRDELTAELPLTEKDVTFCGKFTYLAPFGNLSEHEIDSVFLLQVRGEVMDSLKPNPAEIEELFWWSAEEIEERYAASPESFSAWFKRAFDIAVTKIYPTV